VLDDEKLQELILPARFLIVLLQLSTSSNLAHPSLILRLDLIPCGSSGGISTGAKDNQGMLLAEHVLGKDRRKIIPSLPSW